MSHKLQPSTLENDGSNSVVRDENSISQSEIASHDAGSACVPPAAGVTSDCKSEIVSTENPPSTPTPEVAARSTRLESSSALENFAEAQNSTNPNPTLDPSPANQERSPVAHQRADQPRCEVARSAGYDPTGEHAVACGALAEVVCEYCGPMCASCAEETFCYYGEHKLTQLPDDRPLPTPRRHRRPISEVVYVEIKCPHCQLVRLALPKKHRPQRVRKCPVCKTKAPAEYLAHGFTRRRLPYYEVFTLEKELPEGVEFKQRTPWDRRPNWWVEE